MVQEGARVWLKPGSAIAGQHADLVGALGVVGAIIQGRRWSALDASDAERQADRAAHVRFRSPPVVLLSVPISNLEVVDALDPAMPFT